MTTYARAWTDLALVHLRHLLDANEDKLQTAATWCADSILDDGLVHLFGSGHSRIPVEEFFPRYGSFPGFHPIVELSTTFHTQVVGNNGQRQAMFIERMPGLAEQVLNNYTFPPRDVLLCFSVGGETALPVEIVRGFAGRGLRTIAVTSVRPGNQVAEDADLVIDLAAPEGDALVHIDGLDTPVGPVSSLLYVTVVNELKVRIAALLTAAGAPPPVLSGARVVGSERSKDLFERAYAEHARRAATRLAGADRPVTPNPTRP